MHSSSQVWNDGLPSWIPLAQAPELQVSRARPRAWVGDGGVGVVFMIHLPVCLSIYPPTHPPTHLSTTYPPTHLPTCLPTYLQTDKKPITPILKTTDLKAAVTAVAATAALNSPHRWADPSPNPKTRLGLALSLSLSLSLSLGLSLTQTSAEQAGGLLERWVATFDRAGPGHLYIYVYITYI